MQSDNDGYVSGGCAVTSPDSSRGAGHSGFTQQMVAAVIEAMEPTVPDAVRAQMQSTVAAAVRAQMQSVAAAVRAQVQSSLQEPWFAEIIKASVQQQMMATSFGTGSSRSNLSQSSLSSAGSFVATNSDSVSACKSRQRQPHHVCSGRRIC